jgi:hypothetical protein
MTKIEHRKQGGDAMKTLAVNMRRCCHSPDGGHQLKIWLTSIKNLKAFRSVLIHSPLAWPRGIDGW